MPRAASCGVRDSGEDAQQRDLLGRRIAIDEDQMA